MSQVISTKDIGIIVLAAGSSVRFGTDKRLATLNNGLSILETTLTCIPASFEQRVLVLKAGDEKLAQQYGQHWQICFADAPEKGLANSLSSAVVQVGNWEGAIVALADMPFITTQTYSVLQKAMTRHHIVVPVYEGRRGNPVGFRKKFYSEIEALEGDQGAKPLLQKYSADVYEQKTGDAGIFRDIDKPEMLT
ncbi:MAG: nucleotidyltransferase family protein [Gammaproteobacteria bacterium]|jgi:molybdenum cofactor cytidylyltransferase|nr:nucleotidyltransferase family protein [Gammaproteobacteria bacterium]MBT6043251.1 nucleotidyltransferase family protein [Gammaproteobacteria bacterium]